MPCCQIAPFDLLARLEREGTEARREAARRLVWGEGDAPVADAARETIAVAGARYSSTEQDAVAHAWSAVGVAT